MAPDSSATWPDAPATGDITYNVTIQRRNASRVYETLGTYRLSLNALFRLPGYQANSGTGTTALAIQFSLGSGYSSRTFFISYNIGRNKTILMAYGSSYEQNLYRVRIWREYEEIQPWARVDNAALIPRAKLAAARYLNSVTARGQATVTASNDAAGSAVAFGSVNQVTEGDIVMISLDPATTSDGNATVITRIPPSQEDVWFSANEFQSESGVTDNVQAKLTNGTSYVSMQLERGSHTTAPKFIRGNYTLYRINA